MSIKHITHHEDIPDGSGLKESYGPDVPNPKGFVKGSMVNFGWLAGSGEIVPGRITVEDSVAHQRSNLPGSIGKVGGEKK
jgi:hypothetical protein